MLDRRVFFYCACCPEDINGSWVKFYDWNKPTKKYTWINPRVEKISASRKRKGRTGWIVSPSIYTIRVVWIVLKYLLMQIQRRNPFLGVRVQGRHHAKRGLTEWPPVGGFLVVVYLYLFDLAMLCKVNLEFERVSFKIMILSEHGVANKMSEYWDEYMFVSW